MDPKECIRRNFAAFDRHDIQGVVDTYTEDCELIDVTAAEPAYGHKLLREYAQQLFEAFPDMHVGEVKALLAEGHTVAAQFELVGTHTGEFLGCAPTNKTIHWPTCSFFELTETNDRILRETYYYDSGRLMAQLRDSKDTR